MSKNLVTEKEPPQQKDSTFLNFCIKKDLLAKFDAAWFQRGSDNRTDALKQAIKDFLKKEG